LRKDFEILLSIPIQADSEDYFIEDFVPLDYQYSAFNTHDFQNAVKPFVKYGYTMRKIMERIQDLAIMHSSVNNPVDRTAVIKRYENYLDYHFRDRLAVSIVKLKNCRYDKKPAFRRKIAEPVRQITEAKEIWERYVPAENWGR
jgi:hypothetical protein